MSPRTNPPASRPVPVALCLMALTFVVFLVWAATADAANYRVLLCAGNNGSNSFQTSTNTASPQSPGGIFSFENHCGPAPDPAGNAAFLRIAENQASGNAGPGAYGNIYYDTPAYVHFKAGGGYTRQFNSFNDGWRARFWVASACCTAQVMTQGNGLPNSNGQWASTGIFGPHLWEPSFYYDFTRFVFEMQCVSPNGCDRSNYNATDLNTIVFILEDDQNSQVALTGNSPLMAGRWVRGPQTATFSWSELGSGIRYERIRIDGEERWSIDHQATGECNTASSHSSGEFARVFQPCANATSIGRGYGFDTASLPDGAHTLQACTQDYGQWQGLNGTRSESCDQRTIRTDNSAPGAPAGLFVTSANPQRYLDHFGARFSLPPNQGSPITKVHYSVLDAAGAVVVPEKVISGTNPTELSNVAGPAKAGDYQLRVWLEDEVGFSGPAVTAPIPHDTTPPAAPQGLAVTAPSTPRSVEGFDLRWRNIVDAGSAIDAAHYQVLDGSGKIAVPTTTVTDHNVQAAANIEAPGAAGSYQLRLWLTDAEGNVGAPVTAPLAYDCMRSAMPGAQQLTASLGGHPELTVQQGQGTVLSGSLRGQAGSVATAPVCIYSRVATDSGHDFLGIAMTDQSGGYRFSVPAGPSRELIAIHRPDQRQLQASATVHTVVHPTLRARSLVVHNGEYGYFEGEIPGPHNDNVTIVLQVRSGKGWLAFRRYRTRIDGHYDLSYLFRRTSRPTNYEIRAQVREPGGYPYLQGDSDPLTLRVIPKSGKATTKPTAASKRCKKKARTLRRRGSKRCPKKHRVRSSAAHAKS